MAGQTLEHTGAAIVEEYYPTYATAENTVYPLYSDLVYIGSTIILLSMVMLGLPITALGYFANDMDVGLPLVVIAAVATVAVFLIGLGLTMAGFRKYSREDAH